MARGGKAKKKLDEFHKRKREAAALVAVQDGSEKRQREAQDHSGLRTVTGCWLTNHGVVRNDRGR